MVPIWRWKNLPISDKQAIESCGAVQVNDGLVPHVLSAGDMVFHEQYGNGRVLRLLGSGDYFVNFFRDDVNQYCHYDVLRYFKSNGSLVPAAAPPARFSRHALQNWRDGEAPGAAVLPLGQEGQNVALRILEAMRTGVVGERVELYTIGRRAEMAQADFDLQHIDDGAVRVFLGDYGAGKTHMLECIEAKALNQNCLTARVALNSKDVSPSNPQRVYRALMLNLLYPDHSGKDGLMPLFKKARSKGLIPGWLKTGQFHSYLSPALYYFNRYFEKLESLSSRDEFSSELDQQEAAIRHMLDWLEGQEAKELTGSFNRALQQIFPGRPTSCRFPALKDYRTFGHIYSYILSGIAALARQVGYRGLVLLLDEAEMYNILSGREREFADRLFGFYSALALGSEQVHGGDRLPRGGHANHRSVPVVYNPTQQAYKSGIYCAFAMTVDDGGGLRSLLDLLSSDAFVELKPLSSQDYKRLCSIVIDLYRRAYPKFVCGDNAANAMGQVVYKAIEKGAVSGSRQLLRCILELLDYSRLCRSDIGAYVKEMTDNINDSLNLNNEQDGQAVITTDNHDFEQKVATQDYSLSDDSYDF